MNDEPTAAMPAPTPPATPGSGGNRRWMIAAIAGGVLVVVLVAALILALRNGSDDKAASAGGGSTLPGNAGSSATPAGQSANGVVVVNGGGGNAGTKPPPTDSTTTAPTTTTMTTETTTSGSGGSGVTFRGPGLTFPLNGGIQQVPINPKLDYQSAARFGEANLSNGFSPDPYQVGTSDSGDVNVNYLGGSCSGFTNSAPDLRLNFGGGGASLLRLYFVSSGADASMVVNDPYGNFYCVNDSFGTHNPTIDFNNPAGGSYDIWIAGPSSGGLVAGTLFVTENSGNHP